MSDGSNDMSELPEWQRAHLAMGRYGRILELEAKVERLREERDNALAVERDMTRRWGDSKVEVKRLRDEAEIRNRAYAEGEKSWRAKVERLKRLLDQRGKDAADAEAEVERLREALNAAEQKFRELDLPVYADALSDITERDS